jgi:hypothetical protein
MGEDTSRLHALLRAAAMEDEAALGFQKTAAKKVDAGLRPQVGELTARKDLRPSHRDLVISHQIEIRPGPFPFSEPIEINKDGS